MSAPRCLQHPRLPSVDRVLRTEAGVAATAQFGHQATVAAVRQTLSGLRNGASRDPAPRTDPAAIAAEAGRLLQREDAPRLRRVFNLTGTVLHTNLGRAVLPESAIAAATDAMRFAVALEFDLGDGERGERDDHVRGLIRELTGAEDACLVNNNAAAVLLVLNTFAAGRDAVVSRGELIEIGGSFRLPEIMLRAGARLVEVGTTNRTHLKDYTAALGRDSGLLLKAHTSNYVIRGFTKSVSALELSALARSHHVPFVHDLGSGALVDLACYGLKPEPTVSACLGEGADLVTFSGDKLLGGPQAGIIAGRKELVELAAKNPMKRALRLDKIRLAALEAVLKLYRNPDRLIHALPTVRDFARANSEIAEAAARLRRPMALALGEAYRVDVAACTSQIGSGALPLETLPSTGIAIAPATRKSAGRRLEALVLALRQLPIPVLGHVKDGALILDLRCLDDEATFLGQLAALGAHGGDGQARHVLG
jgi:L-seryl-tRNA(Ser) seleniumtransferase